MARIGRGNRTDTAPSDYPADPAGNDAGEEIAASWDEAAVPDPNFYEADRPATDWTPPGTEQGQQPYEVPFENPQEENVSTATVDTANGVPEIESDSKPRRGRPKLSALPDVPIDVLSAEDVPEDEWVSAPLEDTRARTERDAVQLKVDADVKAVYDAWITAEKPKPRQAPRKRYLVAPEHAPKTRAMLTNAGVHMKVRVIQTKSHQPDGRVAIVFSAVDREPAKKSAKAE
jgi:hypothetical protein